LRGINFSKGRTLEKKETHILRANKIPPQQKDNPRMMLKASKPCQYSAIKKK
jgi:hypothetical protein